jgi:hypothetical protein
MIEIDRLHDQAMDLAEAALFAGRRRDDKAHSDLTRQAYELDRRAADAAASIDAPEPTRSIIHRSAAVLAIECGEHREAERLIARALTGDPPVEIAQELRDLLEEVNFRRHLDLRGIELQLDEFQVSITGAAVSFGLAQSQEALERLQILQTMTYRSLERRSGKPYRRAGPPSQAIRETVFFSSPRAASFAVSVKVGRIYQPEIPALSQGAEVIDDMLAGIDFIESGNYVRLTDLIPDKMYRRNFIGLVRNMAPDGTHIKQVGFTAIRHGEERRASLTRSREEISIYAASSGEDAVQTPHMVVGPIVGRLVVADKKRPITHSIEIVEEKGSRSKGHRFIVPPELMDDIVKPLWGELVEVTGLRRAGGIHLDDIRKAE